MEGISLCRNLIDFIKTMGFKRKAKCNFIIISYYSNFFIKVDINMPNYEKKLIFINKTQETIGK